MKQRRGWIWLASGILLALLAGLLTFQTVNDLAISTSLAKDEVPTVPVLVAIREIEPFKPIEAGMVALENMPTNLVPETYVGNIEDVVGKMAVTPISLGEVIVAHRLTDPTDPDSPVLYKMDPDNVLVAIPATALLGQLGMLTVGNHIDIAYTGEFDYETEKGKSANGEVLTTFLSLQNLEVKGVMRRSPPEEGIALQPDAFLLAVSPQEALIIKYLIDSGAPMDVFLRAPGNQALMPVTAVNQKYLIDYFQLDADVPVNLARDSARTSASPDANQSVGLDAAIQDLVGQETDTEQTQSTGQ